ncbi:MAG TPA: hypothetical protein VIA45_11395 [Thermoanaerobaculia bacterium]
MTPAPRVGRVALAFLWLALFSALYTAGELFGIWPQPPEGAFRNLDLAVGAVAVAAVVAALAFARRAS